VTNAPAAPGTRTLAAPVTKDYRGVALGRRGRVDLQLPLYALDSQGVQNLFRYSVEVRNAVVIAE
jgi:hypothetical protein